MKHLIYLSILLLFLLSISCTEKSNPVETKQFGKVILKIDRANAPQGITIVRATLSRTGYSNIVATMNILSDTTADLVLNNIPVGVWLLKVEALNDSMVVLYSGETEVNILAGIITQVNLTLTPTGQGTGSIRIFVSWGTTQTNLNWIDNPTNPVLSSSNSYFDFYGVAEPRIIFDEGKYKMWYYGDEGSAKKHVLYAESVDGINWTRYPVPVLSPGNSSWDSWAVQPGYVIKEGNTFKMYFVAYSNQNGPWYIGLATSVDGINWVKRSTPVLNPGSGWEFQIGTSFVLKKDNKYYLYYIGRNFPYFNIGLAISNDGINFTKYSGNPILTATQNWEQNGIMYPNIYFENGIYKMIYHDGSNNGFGYAYSNDAINWTKDSRNPFFRRNFTISGWGNASISYPCYIKVNNEERIYYSGYSTLSNKYRIGFLKRN